MDEQGNYYAGVKAERRRSLFVLSLPRSLSTLVYHAACLSLHFEQPAWSSDGELLNLDRFAMAEGELRQPGSKYTRQQDRPELFAELARFLDRSVSPTGYAYKDVVHPFVTAAWLADKHYAVLKIQRDVADVALSMMAQGWYYPAEAGTEHVPIEEAIIEGLLRGWAAIDAIHGPTIDYDAVIADEGVLHRALAVLYPDAAPRSVRFINDAFRGESERLIARRSSERYRKYADLVARISERLRIRVSVTSTEGAPYAETTNAMRVTL